MDINQLCNSINTDEENDWPNQIPIIPIKGFLNFCGIFTSAPHKAKIAIKKAGPKTHGNGNNSILKTDPPSIPINIVLRIILVFFIRYLSKRITVMNKLYKWYFDFNSYIK